MKLYITTAVAALLTAGLALTAPQGNADDFTRSVKEGYHNFKQDVKGAVDDLTGRDKDDARRYLEERNEDMQDYRNTVLEARKDYMQSRQEAQAEYLKDHKQLPIQEDMVKDMDMSVQVRPAGATH